MGLRHTQRLATQVRHFFIIQRTRSSIVQTNVWDSKQYLKKLSHFLDVIVFGLEEFGYTDAELYKIYSEKLTPTERKYYDCWIYWKRFKIQPWRFLNKKTITRDQVLALEQIDQMFAQRCKVKEHKDKVREQEQQQITVYNNLAMPMGRQPRANKTISVL